MSGGVVEELTQVSWREVFDHLVHLGIALAASRLGAHHSIME